MFNSYMKHIIYNNHLKKYNYDLNYDISCQIIYITDIYNDISFEHDIDIHRELKKKYSSYKQQDKLKRKYNADKHITYKEMISKLYHSNLKCYYCTCDVFIIYNTKKTNQQWSLERLDNNIGHYNNNTQISCLGCNLKRRTDNHEYFKFSKQLKINRIE
jgi:hypothetical protein